ncbi:lamin tail domain-containing protein [Sunxiuqinia sp. A32]|uniref:lamin tail domain-containing protein n=1 Tax=Sunxiuqinia sp. A32 TaxID=3461496 RepID=UPI00404523DD
MSHKSWLFLFLIINFLTIESFGEGKLAATSKSKAELTISKKSEIIINEILFDCYPGGANFVELYNNSDQTIELDQMMLATRNENSELEQLTPITNEKRQLKPKEYLVISKSAEKVLVFYQTKNKKNFIDVEQMPKLSSSSGNLVLVDNNQEVIDEVNYSSSMHHALLIDEEGVSIERIDPNTDSMDNANWTSASSRVGYATPGYQNSMTGNFVEIRDEIFIEPKVITPNNDGDKDFLSIYYNFENPSYKANLSIYDSRGSLVNKVVKNESPGQHGEWVWLGTRDDGSKASLGVYVILIELFEKNRKVKEFKKSCSITDRL